MKRKLFWVTLCFIIGIYTSLLFNLKSVFTFAILGLSICFALVFIRYSKKYIYIIICMTSLLLGALYVSYENSDSKSYLADFKGQTITVCARVKDYPIKGAKYYKLEARTNYLISGGVKHLAEENVSLRLYDKECALSPGDIILIEAKVVMPIKSDSITENYSVYLKSKRIYTILSVKSGKCTLLSCEKPTVLESFTILRKKLCNIIDNYLPEREASLLCAIVLGDKTGIDDKTTSAFSNSGLSHIIAVSGLHVGTMYSAFYMLLGRLGLSKTSRYILIIVLLFIYIPLTGMSVSALRAGIMMLLIIISQLIIRRADGLTSLSASALILLLINPFYAFSLSFMLSFGAILGILLFGQKLVSFLCRVFGVGRNNKILYSIISSLALTFSAQIICAPIILIYFDSFTFWTFFSNILIVPGLIYLFCGGLALIFTALLFEPIAIIASYFTLPLLKGILFTADFFGNSIGGIVKIEVTQDILMLYVIFMFLLYRFLNLREKIQKRR